VTNRPFTTPSASPRRGKSLRRRSPLSSPTKASLPSVKPKASGVSSGSSLPPTVLPPKSFWLWGYHAVRAALENPVRPRHQLVATADALQTLGEILQHFPKLDVRQVKREDLDTLLPPQAVHQGVALGVYPLPPLFLDSFLAQRLPVRRLVVVDQITDPHNLGAILRSACAFGVDAVLLTPRHTPVLEGVVAKSASGALDKIPLCWMPNLAQGLRILKKEGFWCVGLCERGDLPAPHLPQMERLALVLGAEGRGLRPLTESLCDFRLRLPTSPHFPTLNVSTAAAVACCLLRPEGWTN